MMKIVIAAGHFNPLHAGHVELFERAKKLGDQLWVIVKNNEQSHLKRGFETYQDESVRISVIESLSFIDKTVLSIDKDLSVNKTLENIIITNPGCEFILAKGGDAQYQKVFEEEVCNKFNIQIIKDLGEKIHSSSDYVR